MGLVPEIDLSSDSPCHAESTTTTGLDLQTGTFLRVAKRQQHSTCCTMVMLCMFASDGKDGSIGKRSARRALDRRDPGTCVSHKAQGDVCVSEGER